MMRSNDQNNFYKSSYEISILITIFFVTAYNVFIKSFLQLNFSNSGIRIQLIELLIEFLVYNVINLIIYKIIIGIKKRQWRYSHKNIWVQGLWLSIHVKKSIRVGTVEIKQDFFSINAKGINVSASIYEHDKRTSWKYIMGKVMDDASHLDYIGCYEAQRIQDGSRNNGLHMLHSETDQAGYICELNGFFGDVIKVTDTSFNTLDFTDHCGQLYLFRISKECEKYLRQRGPIDYNRLRNLHTVEAFSEEPYCKKLVGLFSDLKIVSNDNSLNTLHAEYNAKSTDAKDSHVHSKGGETL